MTKIKEGGRRGDRTHQGDLARVSRAQRVPEEVLAFIVPFTLLINLYPCDDQPWAWQCRIELGAGNANCFGNDTQTREEAVQEAVQHLINVHNLLPYQQISSKDTTRKTLEQAGFVVLEQSDAKWLCDWIHGEPDCEHNYDRAHSLLEERGATPHPPEETCDN